MLKIESAQYDDVIIIYLDGVLVFNETGEAEKYYQEILARKPRVIALDCKKLANMDSTGLGIFIRYKKEAVRSNIELVLLNVTDHVSTLFDASKLFNMFEIISEKEFKDTYLP